MKKLAIKLLAISSGSLFLFSPSITKASSNFSPYEGLVFSSAINFCANEYGLLSDKQTYKLLNKWMKEDYSMEPWQVANLMQRSTFSEDVSKSINSQGGCNGIVTALKKRIKEMPRGILPNRKAYKYYYDVK